jgi:hypothetical protein
MSSNCCPKNREGRNESAGHVHRLRIHFMNSPANPGIPGDPLVSEEVITPPNDTDSDLWTSERVAQYLHVSLKSVFNLRKRGLPFVKVGGAVRFVPQEIKDHLLINRSLASHRLRQIIRKGAAT